MARLTLHLHASFCAPQFTFSNGHGSIPILCRASSMRSTMPLRCGSPRATGSRSFAAASAVPLDNSERKQLRHLSLHMNMCRTVIVWIEALPGIEWVILVGFCLPAKGLARDGVARSPLRAPGGRSSAQAVKRPADMWTIRFAERLRFPRVRCLERLAGWERGEMLAFAHIPAGPAATAMSFEAGQEEDPDRGACCRRARRLNAAAACR
jgi:hypothetical protein